jgi:hypothetical protein
MMAQLSHNLSIMSDGSIQAEPAAPSLPRTWLVPHDRMRINYDKPEDGGWKFNPAINGRVRQVVRDTGKSMPEVYRVLPSHNFKLGDDWLRLLCDINPELGDKALSILVAKLAFCNAQYAVVDQPRVMGGWKVTGTPVGEKLWLKTLRVDQPVPKAADVLADRTAWGWCVGVRPDGNINMWWRKAKNGMDYNVRMFVVSAMPVYMMLDELYPLPAGFIPGPQWMPAT